MANEASEDRLLRPDEVAIALGVSKRQLYRLMTDGRISAGIKLRRNRRWRASEIQEFIKTLK
jgi:excisionase family DNA binding protein